MSEHYDVFVIGAGQACLATGYYLSQQNRNYIILERSSFIASAWRNRWDSFTLVAPNWSPNMPGYPYAGDDYDGVISREEVVTDIEDITATYYPPQQLGGRFNSIEQLLCVT
ncbi:MAG: hypothetical protein BMS9Abin02_1712 [Anaerolineae bacterium]|nr:MAG: hypothetical protein BMS9Abin02_1712 [Anaerolineae bacterium]